MDETGASISDNKPWSGDVNQPFYMHGLIKFPHSLHSEVAQAHVKCMRDTGANTTHMKELSGATRAAVADWALDFLANVPFEAVISVMEGACAPTQRVYDLTAGLIASLEDREVSVAEQAAYKVVLHKILPAKTGQRLWEAFAGDRKCKAREIQGALESLLSEAIRNGESHVARGILADLQKLPLDSEWFAQISEARRFSNRLNSPGASTCVDVLTYAIAGATPGSLIVHDGGGKFGDLIPDARLLSGPKDDVEIRAAEFKGETFLVDAFLWIVKRARFGRLPERVGKSPTDNKWLARLASQEFDKKVRGRVVSFNQWVDDCAFVQFDEDSRIGRVISDLKTPAGTARIWMR